LARIPAKEKTPDLGSYLLAKMLYNPVLTPESAAVLDATMVKYGI
jgi:hypothetical protein